MQLKTLTAIVAIALGSVQAAPNPNALDRAASFLKRSYSHGVDMSQLSKRGLAAKRRVGKPCNHRNSTLPAAAAPPQTQSSSSSQPAEPTHSPVPEPNNNSTGTGTGTSTVNTISTAPDDLAQQWLDAHNTARLKHGALPLAWSAEIADYGKNWASGCKFEHSHGPHGENLAAQTGQLTPAQAVDMWMEEASQYDPNNPQYSHFTQVVWKSSTKLGCAIVTCAPGTIDPKWPTSSYGICEYDPPGNVIGEFAENVQP